MTRFRLALLAVFVAALTLVGCTNVCRHRWRMNCEVVCTWRCVKGPEPPTCAPVPDGERYETPGEEPLRWRPAR